METKDLKVTDFFNEIVQVGIVVEDIEKVKAGMKQIFGLDPDIENDSLYKETWYKGEIIDAPVHAAFYNFFNVQLEFLMPIGDQDTIWSDYLKEGPHHGHSLHHLRFDVDDNDVANELMASVGVDRYMEGTSLINPNARFTYYDSVDKVGFIIEAVTRG